ncbi:MAG TPA: septal ring lytic transglycosylase RlpA family protein [Candidatus Binataceae bacterium]|nr:septal ring lytic transglycosylase RlpA family protein [Candidatus Binataceae bacterium]
MDRGGGGCWIRVRIAAWTAVCALVSACSSTRPVASPIVAAPVPASIPVSSAQVGVASWYGPGFDGHHTASGEIYDQEDLTAASPTLPLGTQVIVTNLDNGRSVALRINDRGPFVKGRQIDLSHRAASILGIVRPGTARVRVDVVSFPSAQVVEAAHGGYFVQVGSFSQAANAERLRQRLALDYSDVSVQEMGAGNRRFYRVRMGSFETRDQAQQRALQSARLGLPIVVVRE